MALLEASERRPFADVDGVEELPGGGGRVEAALEALPCFAPILDELYETRPGDDGPRKVTVREALLEHASLWRVPQAFPLFTEGTFGEHLFFVLDGRVRVTTSFSLDEGRTATVPIEDVEPGAFVGEHSALTQNAHLVSATSLEPCRLLLVPQFIAQELTESHEPFRAVITQDYVSRLLETLIRRLPSLESAGDGDRRKLLEATDLRSAGVGDVLFEEGDEAEHVFVIADGFVKITRREGSEQRVLSYLVEGDAFGELAVLDERPRTSSAVAMSDVQVLAIPAEAFRDVVSANPAIRARAEALRDVQKLEADMAENVTFIGSRMELQAEVMPNLDVLVINQDICVRCDNCVRACAEAHDDGFSRLIRKGVLFQELLLPTACRSCRDPSCLLCKSGGIKRDKDGDIYFTDSCIGCSGCAQRCPYGNITMVDTDEIGKPAVPTLLDLALRRDGRHKDVPESRDARPRLKKIPVKCDMDRDHAFPACVNNCPTGAIRRYRSEEIDQILAGRS